MASNAIGFVDPLYQKYSFSPVVVPLTGSNSEKNRLIASRMFDFPPLFFPIRRLRLPSLSSDTCLRLR